MADVTPIDAARPPSLAQDPTQMDDLAALQLASQAATRIRAEVAKRVVGQASVIELLLTALFSDGHALAIGVPGLAKTLLIRTLSEALTLQFARIQFTPDMMPSDVTGTEILEEERATGHRHYRFARGPVFTNILLADELNRTPPKTQAALLQAMQEHEVSAGGRTYQLERPFLVMATQNPIEQHGTYPLPEAQVDRFMLAIDVRYPSVEEEREIVRMTTGAPPAPIEAVVTRAEILRIQELVRSVPVADHVIDYAVRLVRATRPNDPLCPAAVRPLVALGASPRASQWLIVGAKARAVLDGRSTVTLDDVRSLAVATVAHRVVPSFRAEAEGSEGRHIVAALLERVPAAANE
jgi:MoxR-like ATPase